MKVRINPDGSMEFDVDDVGQALTLARMQAEQQKSLEPEPISTSELTAVQYDLWSFLVDNDSAGGVHLSAVARHFHITTEAASQRLLTMVRTGHLKRVRRGYYRAVV